VGYYLEVPEFKKKADQLVRLHKATKISGPPYSISELPEKSVLVCVVENPSFDAAAVCYSDSELRDFNDPTDSRRKTWLLMDLDEVLKMNPRLSNVLVKERQL